MGLIIFDFLAFLYILAAYLMMCRFTVTGSYERSGGTSRGASFSSVDELRSREDRLLWQRISRLLITDFLCWIPICITCFVSLGEVEIPSVLYKISAIILLPINSAVNPLLYSNAVNTALECLTSKWLQNVHGSYASLCKRLGANGTPPSGSRGNGANVESPCDDQQTNGGMVSGVETRSITLPENDRSRLGTRADMKHLISRKEMNVCLNGNNIQCELADECQNEGMSDGVTSPNRCKRSLSERQADRFQLNDFGKGITYHRPKSQSTTSTCTTFTTIAQDDC